MKYVCPLLAVSDLATSKRFYQEIFDQEVTLDLGWNISFSGGFAIQLNFDKLLGLEPNSVATRSHNFELYFEEDDFDAFLKKLEQRDDIEYVHPPKQYEWQQRVVRIYDPDKHIIEIGESMAVIAKRYLTEGKTLEETAQIIQHPVEFVQAVADGKI
jgi:catechol 2,3-dioxygenase-like lactoylglutathione lyase family enzyme